MNVPDVVKIAIRMNAHIATDGPEIQSQPLRPRKTGLLMPAGASPPPSIRWMMPRGSSNQFGPLIEKSSSMPLIAPEAENRNSHRTVMATDDVTDGK